jgi:hypothetical protein
MRLISTVPALARELQEVFSVPEDLPNSIARALARLESHSKTNRPDGAHEGQRRDGVTDKIEGVGISGRKERPAPADRRAPQERTRSEK